MMRDKMRHGGLLLAAFLVGVAVLLPRSASPAAPVPAGQVSGYLDASGMPVGVSAALPLPILSRPVRAAAGLYRTGLTAVDKLTVPVVGVATDNTADGTASLAAGTAYKYAAAAGNVNGVTTAAAAQSLTTAADANAHHSFTIPITQVAGATTYDIFLSVDTAPKWVGRITEAQRAAGGAEVTAVGTVDALGANAAGTVKVQVVGTGDASTGGAFVTNAAYTTSGMPAINCSGYTTLWIHTVTTVTDLRTAPSLQLVQLQQDPTTALWHFMGTVAIAPSTNPYHGQTNFNVAGSAGVAIGIELISGPPGMSVAIYDELQ